MLAFWRVSETKARGEGMANVFHRWVDVNYPTAYGVLLHVEDARVTAIYRYNDSVGRRIAERWGLKTLELLDWTLWHCMRSNKLVEEKTCEGNRVNTYAAIRLGPDFVGIVVG